MFVDVELQRDAVALQLWHLVTQLHTLRWPEDVNLLGAQYASFRFGKTEQRIILRGLVSSCFENDGVCTNVEVLGRFAISCTPSLMLFEIWNTCLCMSL